MTKKELLYKRMARFEELTGLTVEVNIWENHTSVYTKEDGCQKDQILCTTSVARAVEIMENINQVAYLLSKRRAK